MYLDIKKDKNLTDEEDIEIPSFLPRLFIAPSSLPKFSMIVAEVSDMKVQLLKKTIQLRKESLRTNKDHEIIDKLDGECAWLRLEIEGLEYDAKEMRKELVDRIYVEVRSVKEMKAVNELRSDTGIGATPGMRCFQGRVFASLKIHKELMKAMAIAERLGEIF